MTLIIAGFEKIRDPVYLFDLEQVEVKSDLTQDLEIAEQVRSDDCWIVDGIYFVADSAITIGDKTLLNGFKKIHKIAGAVWKPLMSGGQFRGYFDKEFEFSVAIAFAGNTLSAQHYMNVISNHLENLRMTILNGYYPFEYDVILDCQRNPIMHRGLIIDEDGLNWTDCRKYVSADRIANIVKHSIEHGLESAREYKLDENDFKSLVTEMILAVKCPFDGEYYLYQYTMEPVKIEGISNLRVVDKRIGTNELAIIGRKTDFSAEAQNIHDIEFSKGNLLSEKMYAYLNCCITKANSDGDKSIARPSVLKIYKENKLKLAKHINPPRF